MQQRLHYRWCSVDFIDDQAVRFEIFAQHLLHLCRCFQPRAKQFDTPVVTAHEWKSAVDEFDSRLPRIHFDYIVAGVFRDDVCQRCFLVKNESLWVCFSPMKMTTNPGAWRAAEQGNLLLRSLVSVQFELNLGRVDFFEYRWSRIRLVPM